MSKADFTRIYKSYYSAKNKPERIHIEPAVYLSIAGQGNPSLPSFAGYVQALYTIAYAVKFRYKALAQDFVVPKLEGLWWYDEQAYAAVSMGDAPRLIPREAWQYLLLLRMPEDISAPLVDACIESAAARKEQPLLREVQLHRMAEGDCVQMLHTGSFDREPESLAQILAYCEEHRLQRNGPHHEIYLSDFRKTSPDRLRTILREPVK